jgi:nucleoside-diphosphate-sugar epimerase
MKIASGLSGTIGMHLRGFTSLGVRAESRLDRSVFPEFLDFDYLHLAAIVDNVEIESDLHLAKEVNLLWPARLAKDFLKTGSRGKFVFLSTGQVYGSEAIAASEESSTNPANRYSRLKLEAEAELIRLFADHPDQLIIVRLFSVLSPWGRGHSLGGRIRRAMAMPGGGQMEFFNPDSVRDFIQGRDLHAYFEKIMVSDAFGLLNVGSGNPRTVRSAVEKVLTDSGYASSRLSWFTVEEPSHLSPDVSKLRAAIGNQELDSKLWSWRELPPT